MNLQVTTSATKADLIKLAEKTVNEISETNSSINTVEILSRMEFLIDHIKKNKDFIEMVRTEIEYQKGKQITTATGTKVEMIEAGTKYDYSQTNDAEWTELNETLQHIKAKISEREQFLKAIPSDGITQVTQDGEVITIFKPSKTSVSTYKITLAK